MQWLIQVWPIGPTIGGLVVGGLLIGMVGSRLSGVVDRLADRTGMGEAMAGSVLLGAATSLPGLTVSIVAASAAQPSLAVSNSVGGIAAQTAFIVVADAFHRQANIEHAAPSLTNVFNTLLLAVMLSIVLMTATGPGVALAGIHPSTPILLAVYLFGLRIAKSVGAEGMWRPRRTPDTKLDVSDQDARQQSLKVLAGQFAWQAITVAAAGFVVGRAGVSLMEITGLTGTVVGAFVTSIATSLPELVTSVAAVRAGALTLAIGGIIGGNVFDVLFVAASDVAYRQGSIYQAVTDADLFVIAWTIALVGVLGAGLVRRARRGIGFEGVAILVLYAAGVVVVNTLA